MKRVGILFLACLLGGVGCSVLHPTKPNVQPNIKPAADVLTATVNPAVQDGVVNAAVGLAGSAISSTGSTINSWAWNYGDGVACIGSPQNTKTCLENASHTYVNAGSYVVYFSATDAMGSFGQAKASVTVSGMADVLSTNISLLSGGTVTVATGIPTVFGFTVTSTMGMLTNVTTDCGNGVVDSENLFYNPPNGATLTIVGSPAVTSGFQCLFPAGTYSAKVSATDSLGKSASATLTLTVPMQPCPTTGLFGYRLPPWITALTWIAPADIVYGGTVQKPTQTNTKDVWLPPAYIGQTFCMWLGAGGGTPPYTFSGQGLPPGMVVRNFATYGLVAGPATTPGNWTNVLFTVKDSAGATQTLRPRSIEVCVPLQGGSGQSCNGFGN